MDGGQNARWSAEPAAVAGRNRDVGVEGEARGRGAAGRAGAGEFIRVDAVASPGRAATLSVEATNGGSSQTRQAGLVRGQRIGRGRVGLGADAEAIEKPVGPECDLLDDAPDLVIVRKRKGTEAHPGHAVMLMDSIEDEGVEVNIEVERVAEALDEGDRAAPGSPDGSSLAGAAAVGGEHLEHELAQDRGSEAGVEGEAIAQGERERQDSLAHGDFGEDPVDEVSGGVGHAATGAGGAESITPL